MKEVKDIIAKCSESDVIIIRNKGTELRAINIEPFNKVFAAYLGKKVRDYWRENNAIIILLEDKQ